MYLNAKIACFSQSKNNLVKKNNDDKEKVKIICGYVQ